VSIRNLSTQPCPDCGPPCVFREGCMRDASRADLY
jgi:hypothetical protein